MSFANYKWNTFVTKFSQLAPADKKTVLNIGSSLSVDTASWNSVLEFRTLISYSHELVHYYQDILTGVGHSDFLKYKKLLPTSFMWAKQMLSISSSLILNDDSEVYKTDPYFKVCYDEFLKLYNQTKDEFVFAKSYLRDKNLRKIEIENYLNHVFEGKVIINESEGLLVESLFENEAVATVYLTLMNLKQNENQAKIRMDNDFLIRPDKMPSLYNESISILISFVNDSLKDKADFDTIFKVALTILIFLIDIASSYPTPDILTNSKLEKIEFEPGVKFVRLLNSFNKMSKSDADEFSEAFKNNNSDRAETVLLNICDIDYPSSKSIYAEWQSLFEAMLEENDDILIQLRVNACRNRVQSNSSSFRLKNVTQLFLHNTDIPVGFLTSSEGITVHTMNQQNIGDFRFNLITDIIKWNRDLRLFDMLYISGEFHCPFAETNTCSVAKSSCSRIQLLENIPKDSQCFMNKSIQYLI